MSCTLGFPIEVNVMHISSPRSVAMASQRGVSLIEVMISVLIMGIGMLGVAALQATALRNNQSSFERSQVVVGTTGVFDAMRANLSAARSGNYNMSMTCVAPSGTSQVVVDQRNFINSLQAIMGASACGAINCSATACQVTVQWDDSRGSHAAADATAVQTQQFQTVTRL